MEQTLRGVRRRGKGTSRKEKGERRKEGVRGLDQGYESMVLSHETSCGLGVTVICVTGCYGKINDLPLSFMIKCSLKP
jgi:hypothetical protein